MYPSQNAVEKAKPGMWYSNRKMYIKKNGNQQAINDPIINPRINVALFSFFLAILRFSRSGSRGFCTRGTCCSMIWFLTEQDLSSPLFRFLLTFRPKIGLHSLSFSGFTTAQRDTTPESELLGSNSLTMSVSIPTEGWRILAIAAACCWSSPFTERVELRNWHWDIGVRDDWPLAYT